MVRAPRSYAFNYQQLNLFQRALTAWTTSNITAGSDTTAILLRTVIYNLLRQPKTLERLQLELENAACRDQLSELVTWKETRELPYLDACIKEAGRMHPPFGLPLERVVPSGGATICGQHFQGGTVVGMSGWVVHRDRHTFGDDCDLWRPERWLCEEPKRRKMEQALLTVSTSLFPFVFPTACLHFDLSVGCFVLLGC